MSEILEHEAALFDGISLMLDELDTGLPLFAAQAAEQVFKAHSEISTLFDKRQVKNLQRDVQRAAVAQTERIIGQLADETLWLIEPPRKVRESLHHNPKVWKIVQQLSPALDAVLERYGYPPRPGRSSAAFAQTELLSSDQLPNAERLKILVIKYFSQLMRYQQQRVDRLKQEQAAHHRKLDEMWNH